MVRFITLAGKKQTGKDTAAHMIKELLCDQLHLSQWGDTQGPWTLAKNHKTALYITHFADALKRACHVVFGIPLEDMETEEGKQKETHVPWPLHTHDGYVAYGNHAPYTPDPRAGQFMSVREILQFVGTDLFRKQMRADIWVESVFRRFYKKDSIVVVADCRFPNEAIFAKEHGVLIGIERNTGLIGDGHISEIALDDYNDYDYVLDNNSSFDDLRYAIKDILEREKLLESV